MSGIGVGYLSGNSLVPFPFEDGQCLAWESGIAEVRNELQIALQGCFVDAGIYLDSEQLDDSNWPVVGDFKIEGRIMSFRMGSGDDSDDVLVTVPAFNDKFRSLTGSAPWGRYVITISSEGVSRLASLCESISIYPPPAQATSSSAGREGGFWLRICPRCITLMQNGLKSIMVYDGKKSDGHTLENGPHFVVKGQVSIVPGNNMQLQPPDDESVNGFKLSAVAGAGEGVCPCVCEERPEGNSALAGSDGHARIFNDTCYDLVPGTKYMEYVEPLGREAVTQDINLHVKCTACCTCAMYEDIVNNRLVALAEAVRGARSRIMDMLSSYEEAVRLFNNRLAYPRLTDVSLTLTGMPIGHNVSPSVSGSNVKGRMSRCAFTAVVRNSSHFEMMATVRSINGTGSIVESSAAWTNADGDPQSSTGDSDSGVVGKTFPVLPGRSLVVTYISKKPDMVTHVATGGFNSSIYVNLSYKRDDGSGAFLGTLHKLARV